MSDFPSRGPPPSAYWGNVDTFDVCRANPKCGVCLRCDLTEAKAEIEMMKSKIDMLSVSCYHTRDLM